MTSDYVMVVFCQMKPASGQLTAKSISRRRNEIINMATTILS